MRVERTMRVTLKVIHVILREAGYALPPAGKVTIGYELDKSDPAKPVMLFTWYKHENDFVSDGPIDG